MKFSDLNKEGKKALPHKEPTSPPKPPEPAFPPLPQQPPEFHAPADAPVSGQKPALDRRTDSSRLVYGHAINAVRDVIRQIERGDLDAYQNFRKISSEILEQLETRAAPLLALTRCSTAGNYLWGHSANVAILSLHIAQGLKWDREDIVLLGISALLHDIGMTKHACVVAEPRVLTENERKNVNRHPLDSQELLAHVRDIEKAASRVISETIVQQHERVSGKGYPQGLRGQELRRASQVLGLCDIYEAMTHPRSWRGPLLPDEALKTILRSHAQDFDPKFIKLLLDRLSLFPIGSYVKLSSGDVARVTETFSRYPTRPSVEIYVTADGTTQVPPAPLNLLNNPIVHITHAVDETQLNISDKRLLLQLEANRWWTD